MTESWAPAVVEQALRLAQADQAIVLATDTATTNVRWANSSLTTNGLTHDRSVTVIAFVGDAVGIAARDGLLDESALRSLVDRAVASAHAAAPAQDARPLLMPSEAASSLGDWDATSVDVGIDDVAAFTPALADVFARGQKEDWQLSGYAEQSVRSLWVGSSTGVRLRHDQPDGSVTSTARTPASNRSVWAGRYSRQLGDADVAGLGDELACLMRWSDNRIELPAGRYDVIIPPTAVSDLMVYLLWSMSGRAADEGRSVFSRPGGGTRLGERIAAPGLSLWSDPAAPGLGCCPFIAAHASHETESVFDNGLPVGRTDWIRDGTLQHLIDTRSSAAGGGRQPTPPPGNILLDAGGAGSVADLVARTERGLLLTSIWYIREVDPQTLLLTGLTRDGVFLVEDGSVVGAVNNFRWNESPIDILDRIADASAVEQTIPREWGDYWTLAACPAIRVRDFNMSSVSQAT